jgi:molybdenum cofactor cytidylyltransferase
VVLSSTSRIAAVIPAAGHSARMGCDKRRLMLGTMTLLETTASNLAQAGCSPVVVVLEPASPCSDLKILREAPISIVELQYPSPNMRSSICAGFRSLPPQVTAAAIMPADCPLITAPIVRFILEKYVKVQSPLFIPTFQGEQGHPRIVASGMFDEIVAMPEQDRFSAIFSRRADVSVLFETGEPLYSRAF